MRQAKEANLARAQGMSTRLKLALSYAGFLMLAGALLLAAAWVFLLRGVPVRMLVPTLSSLPRAFEPSNFGPAVFGAAATVVMSFLLVFGLLGGWVLAGRMLAPLTRIGHAARQAANGSLSHRIHLPGRNDEFHELADAFDTMLAQLEALVAEQRRFAANASHELRTPLAITQALLDVARQDPHADTAELVERLHAVNTRAIRLTEALLLLSRTEQRSFVRDRVDLSLVVEEAVETLLLFAETRGLAIETSGEAACAVGSGPLLLQMATNLLHNAIVHNRPDHGVVQVRTAVRADAVELVVENSGETLAATRLSILTEPFQRGAERMQGDHAGVGLGLAIVKSIVQAHDGTLTLAPRAGGGLRVTVRLPAAAGEEPSAPGERGPSPEPSLAPSSAPGANRTRSSLL